MYGDCVPEDEAPAGFPPGTRVRLIANPARVGVTVAETEGGPNRLRQLVVFPDGDDFVLCKALEKVTSANVSPERLIADGHYGRVKDLRGSIAYCRLSGKLANLIYSLNTTNTQFLPYQFKPLLAFLDSPCNGVLIADEVGLGKTIEAGLIWTELRAREDAKRLLVLCPAMLCEKWQAELEDRFGVAAEIVNAREAVSKLEAARTRPDRPFALIGSMQGMRPPSNWGDDANKSGAARLARFLEQAELDEPLFDLVIVDEAHYLRNQETRTHELAQLVRGVAQSLLLLSATPIQLKSRDLYTLLHLLDENAFPFENSFEETLRSNAPVVALRDRVLGGIVSQSDFVSALQEALDVRIFDDNEQIEYLIDNPPSDETLSSAKGRSAIAEQLDRINPLAKVVTRTLKRDVQEMRVARNPVTIRVSMNEAERQFYEVVTEAVRLICSKTNMSVGFMLTTPQRQMSSCMAASSRKWLKSGLESDEDDDDAETCFEAFGETECDADPSQSSSGGTLNSILATISAQLGPQVVTQLEAHDSKYEKLVTNLKQYWSENSKRKVVLFAFFKQTLYYLRRRLEADGIRGVVLHGGMDKMEIIRHFADPSGPEILLSSEVASEGVDLQFSSVVINYDLPWNPARIEQRIGRIDRIGQEAESILIWNFVYGDTIDDRIYVRLLERLNIFTRALGSYEVMLGDLVRELSYELLSHELTPERQEQRIDTAAIAIENAARQQEVLESEATNLIAHGDFVQAKVRAAREIGSYIRGEDILQYVDDFIAQKYPGARLLLESGTSNHYFLETTSDFRTDFRKFIDDTKAHGQTRIGSEDKLRLIFENRHGRSARGIERITQEHPLVRFVSARLKAEGGFSLYSRVAAISLEARVEKDLEAGLFAFAVSQWSFSGARSLETLRYVLCDLASDRFVDGQDAERISNLAALEGTDWLAARNDLEDYDAPSAIERCRHFLDDAFTEFRGSQERENRDRIKLMTRILEEHLKAQQRKSSEKISQLEATGTDRQKRILPAMRERARKQEVRLSDRIAAVRRTETTEAEAKLVVCGVLRIV
jgi:superfamily II DNA or RNA helicase